MSKQTKPGNRGNGHVSKATNLVADRILELLERGELPPWDRPWRINPRGIPCNAVTLRPYRGINVWMTRISQEIKGYRDHRWLTYKQAQQAGGNVRRGEKATVVVFWKMLEKENKDGKPSTFPMAATYNVFNAEQTEGCKLPELPELPEPADPIAEAEAVIAGMPNPPAFETYESENIPPHYRPLDDLVRVPDRRRYHRIELYYNTVYHELTHATGHPRRLDRFDPAHRPDLHEYGVEELVAGMGSAMLADLTGISHVTITPDASYVKHWSEVIKADRSIVINAAQRSQKAVDYITGRNPEKQPADTAGTSPHTL